MQLLLDGLCVWLHIQLMLNQVRRDSSHISRFRSEDVPIILEELDELAFLFRIQLGHDIRDFFGVTWVELYCLLLN
jgi:hypothetical protein